MEFTHIIGWAVFGLVAGALARLLHPGRDPMNWLWTMVLGILGAVVGGWVGTQVFGANANSGLMSWVLAVVGAIVLLFAYNMLTGRRAAVGHRHLDHHDGHQRRLQEGRLRRPLARPQRLSPRPGARPPPGPNSHPSVPGHGPILTGRRARADFRILQARSPRRRPSMIAPVSVASRGGFPWRASRKARPLP